MNTHLTEDELILHYYGEMADAEEGSAAAHLSQCRDCHAQYRNLQRVLAVVDEATVSGAELPEGFERTLWARLEPNLQRDRPNLFSWFVHSPARLAWAAGVLLLVSGAFFAGRLSLRAPEAPGRTAGSAAQVREGILLIDLSDHLDRSQMMLVELASAEAEGSLDVSRERARAEQLVAANRLYRQTAASTGDGAIVDFLDDLERLLVDLAASPEELSPEQLASVRRRIDTEGLLFKLRVLSSEVRDRQKTAFQLRAGERSTM